MKRVRMLSLFVGLFVLLLLPVARAAAAATDVWLDLGTALNGQATKPSASDVSTVEAALSPSNPATVPFWHSSFAYQGVTYPYQMVGTDPSGPAATTVVPTVIIPIDLTFHDVRGDASSTLNGSSIAGIAASSPLFNATTFAATGDTTQYGDSIQRAEFAGVLGSPRYHVLLGTPTVAPAAHIDVPASKGYVDDPVGDGVSRGFITDSVWWRAQRRNLIDTYGITPNELVIMLTKDMAVGLALGVHSARATGSHIQTSIWASWLSPRWAVPFGFQPSFDQDIQGLGHEVAEWLNDPFDGNSTPPWSFTLPPLVPQACSNALEVGDPLELAQFPVTLGATTYHFQDEAFLSWFARQTPSIGYFGRYSFTGTFTSYSTPC